MKLPKKRKPNAIEKALEILGSFIPHNPWMGTVEIGQNLGLHTATVSRTLLILANKGYLQQDPETKKYRLGPAVMDLGRAANHSLQTNIVVLARPLLEDFRTEIRECVGLEVLSGKQSVVAYVADGPRPFRIGYSAGDHLPLHAAAGAKAILAFSPPEVLAMLIENELPRFTSKTITDLQTFLSKLKEIRKKGFACDLEEIDIGIKAIGAPIFDHDHEPVGAVVVAGPSRRIATGDGSPLVASVKSMAAKVSELLQHKGKIGKP